MEHEHAASLTARAVKKALPERAILTKDARQTLNSAASVFTLYLASLAHETSVANKRSTITLKDVLQTLRDADFEHFIEPIEACLQEAKAAASRKKNLKAAAGEEEEETEATNEVAEQLDEVAIDTNEEDADEGMLSVDEPSDAEEGGSDAEEDTKEGSADDAMQHDAKTEQEPDSRTARERKTEDEDEDSAEAMEQS